MLEKIPEEGDSFTYKKLNVTVRETDQKKVLECVISVGDDDKKDQEE
jgi:CBS domain containing-hemolysin-like protein